MLWPQYDPNTGATIGTEKTPKDGVDATQGQFTITGLTSGLQYTYAVCNDFTRLGSNPCASSFYTIPKPDGGGSGGGTPPPTPVVTQSEFPISRYEKLVTEHWTLSGHADKVTVSSGGTPAAGLDDPNGDRTWVMQDGQSYSVCAINAPGTSQQQSSCATNRVSVSDSPDYSEDRLSFGGYSKQWLNAPGVGVAGNGERFPTYDALKSPNAQHNRPGCTLYMQGDGNLVLYTLPEWRALWSTGTQGHNGAWATFSPNGAFKPNGSLHVYGPDGRSLWSSNTDGKGVALVQLQNDCNLVMYDRYHRAVWATGTDWASRPFVAEPATPRRASSSPAVALHGNAEGEVWITPGGAVMGRVWGPNTGWTPARQIAPPLSAQLIGNVTSVSRYADQLDIFWIAPDGSVKTAWWNGYVVNDAGGWSTPITIAGPGSASAVSAITAVSRVPGHLDVFWVAPDGSVRTNWWDDSRISEGWTHLGTIAGPASATTNYAGIASISRIPEQVDVFWIRPNGAVSWRGWSQNGGVWTPAQDIAGPGSAATPRSGLASVTRIPAHVDVFWIAPDGTVRSNWWDSNVANEGWNHLFNITGPKQADASWGSPLTLSAIARIPEQEDLFWVTPNGSVRTDWWNQNRISEAWNHAFDLAGPDSASV